MDDRSQAMQDMKILIRKRHELRGRIDCIDLDIREIERFLNMHGFSNGLEPRCY
jgi:hypothetical protein